GWFASRLALPAEGVALARCEGGRCHTTVPAPGDGPSMESPMSSLVTPATEHSVAGPTAEALHRRFLEIVPVIERHGKVYFRHLKCWHRVREALAEMVAIAWKWFLKLVQKGKDAAAFPTVIAAYAARAVRSGRRLCGQERARDVMSPRAQQRKGFSVQSLPA